MPGDMIRAADVREGDLIDLHGDKYADPDGPYPFGGRALSWLEYECAQVIDSEQETDECVRVDFDGLSVGFPTDHLLHVTGGPSLNR